MDIASREVISYVTVDGRVPFREWFYSLHDEETSNRIRSRLGRLRSGDFGDFRQLGQGVSELRLHFGPGYRVYFGLDGSKMIILLCGGDKSSQWKDIKPVQSYWMDYWRRKREKT